MTRQGYLLMARILLEHAFLVRCWFPPIILNFSHFCCLIFPRLYVYPFCSGVINCYVCFQLSRAGSFTEDNLSFSRSFWVGLLRNRGEKIDFTVKEEGYALFTSLSYLLWNDFQVYKYESPNFIWQFTATNELKDHVELIIFDLEKYGIPWLEAS
jgi:hypothetical protein